MDQDVGEVAGDEEIGRRMRTTTHDGRTYVEIPEIARAAGVTTAAVGQAGAITATAIRTLGRVLVPHDAAKAYVKAARARAWTRAQARKRRR